MAESTVARLLETTDDHPKVLRHRFLDEDDTVEMVGHNALAEDTHPVALLRLNSLGALPLGCHG